MKSKLQYVFLVYTRSWNFVPTVEKKTKKTKKKQKKQKNKKRKAGKSNQVYNRKRAQD